MRCLLALFLFVGVLSAKARKDEQKGTIHGVVKETTGAPAAGITVSASHGPKPGDRTLKLPHGKTITVAERAANAVTDDAGRYAFTNLTPGTYSLRTARDPATRSVTIEASEEHTVDFVVPTGQTISGHVVDQSKNPVADAFVYLLKPEYRNGVLKQAVSGPRVTNDDGSYSFDTDLETNRRYYILVDRAPAATYYPAAARMDDAAAVIVQPGETRALVDIEIAPAPVYCVDGKIQSSGKPAAVGFAVFEAPLAGTNLARLHSSSGEDGKFHFCGLPSSAYRLSTAQGSTGFSVAGSDVEHIDVTLDMASPHVQVDWDAQPAGRGISDLRMQVMDEPREIAVAKRVGVAIRLLQSEIESLEPSVLLSGIDNEFGGPIRDGVPAGDYFVNAGSQLRAYVKEMTYNSAELPGGVLRLAPAANGTLRIVLARDTAELAVAVADSEGKPAPDATVIVVPESVTSVPALSRVHNMGHTDPHGNVTLRDLAPGKYKVLATPQTVRWEVPEDLQSVLLMLYQAKDVQLEPKASAQITLAPVRIF